MHEADRERGIDPRSIERAPAPPPPPAAPGLWIERPNWELEAQERAQREHAQEQQERQQIVAEELARVAGDDEPPETLPRRRGWQRREKP